MKPADLRPGHRIPLSPPSYAPTRSESIVVCSEPEIAYDPGHERIIVGVESGVEATDWIGPGEMLERIDAVRVEGMGESPGRYRVWFHPDTDVNVEK